MTMLDRMRRHKGWLKWSLALVVLAFVIFYIPAFLGRDDSGAALPDDMVASVDGRTITVNEFRRAYYSQLQMYRGAYGGNINEQMLKQLGIEQQILQQMVDERAALEEASRRGISVTDAEVAQHIVAIPAFQENGQFVGHARYAAMLRMQRPPVSPEEFEESLRRSLVVDKLRAALTQWVTVTDREVEQEHRRRNEKVKLELVAFTTDQHRANVTVTDADLAPYFEAHKEQYRIGERRRIRYLLVDVDAIRGRIQVPARDIERAYAGNLETYSTPEQVRASHILFKLEGKQENDVKARAEQVLKEIRSGGDFAVLARKHSEDETSAKQGGDLDFMVKGRMAPEFDAVAFTLEPGQVSDVIKSSFGFHIVKVVEKKAAATRPLEEVRPQITEQLTFERAQQQAGDLTTSMEREIRSPADLDRVGASHGLKVQESGFFAREEPIMGLGPSPQVSAEAFEMKPEQVSSAVRVSRGYAFFSLLGTPQPPRLPTLDEVKDRVREDLTKQKAKDLALQKATAVAPTLKAAADFAKAAKAAKLEVKTTELVARDTPLPDLGASAQVDRVVFGLPAGAVTDPIVTDAGVAIVRVVEHAQPATADQAAERERIREDLVNDRRGRFFSAYMVKAKQKMRIEVNRENIQRVIGQ